MNASLVLAAFLIGFETERYVTAPSLQPVLQSVATTRLIGGCRGGEKAWDPGQAMLVGGRPRRAPGWLAPRLMMIASIKSSRRTLRIAFQQVTGAYSICAVAIRWP